MQFKNYIEDLIDLSRSAEREDELLQKKYGIDSDMGIVVGDPNATKYAVAQRAEIEKIEHYLAKLPYDIVLKIETLMYFGREPQNGTFYQWLDYFRNRNESKDEIIRTIKEKAGAYPVYFKKAIEVLESQGIDINTL